MQYRSEIDGLRAIAITSVILFHAGFSLFSGGYLGVDIFFVISGYLITSTVLEELSSNEFSLIKFYERRARRILPALFFLLIICFPLAWLLLLPNEMKEYSKSQIATVAFFSNIFFLKTSGYFDLASETKPLLHTWSLSVEEQFYLIFPLLLIATWRFKKICTLLFIAIFFSSLFLSQSSVTLNPNEAFFAFHNRAWELLLGSFSAYYLLKFKTKEQSFFLQNIATFLGLFLIFSSIFIFTKNSPSPGIITLIPTLGTVLIIIFTSKDTLAFSILSSPILVRIGLISYSAYLWHQPVFAYCRRVFNHQGSNLVMAGLVSVSFLIAYFSWKYIERPFRTPGKISRHTIFKISFLCFSFFLLLGVSGIVTKGYEDFYVSNRMSDVEKLKYKIVKEHTGKDITLQMIDDGVCNYWTNDLSDESIKRFKLCSQIFKKAIIVLGDSHAMNLFNILSKANLSNFLLGVSKPGCRPHNDTKNCHYDNFMNFLKENNQSIDYVIFHQSGSYLLKDTNGKVDSNLIFEDKSPFLFHTKNYNDIVNYINLMASFSSVHWWGPFAQARVNFNDFRTLKNDLLVSSNSINQLTKLDLYLKDLNSQYPFFSYFSLIDALDIGENFLIIDSCITFNDTDHFSACGETIVAQKLSSNNFYRQRYTQ